jgi:hypothetical protein
MPPRISSFAYFIFAVVFMLAGSAPAVQGANSHTRQARFHIWKCGAGGDGVENARTQRDRVFAGAGT